MAQERAMAAGRVPAISGRTEVIPHLGVPTESFKAPLIYNPYFAARGIDAVVVPMGCEAADFPDFLRLVFRLRNVRGALVTMPHKATTLGLVDRASPAARIAGACNAVRREADGSLSGDMFDGEGFVRAMRAKGRAAAGARALVLGCGGVGSAIAAGLAGAGAAEIGLFDPNGDAAAALADRLRTHCRRLVVRAAAPDPAGWEIVVNATPLGMRADDPLPADPARLDPGAFVGEVVLSRAVTPFLAAARARGCAIQIGLDMLFEMIPAYLAFFGLPPADAAELRALAALPDAD